VTQQLNEGAVESLINLDIPEIEATAEERILAALGLGNRLDYFRADVKAKVVVEIEVDWRTRVFEGDTVEEVIEQIKQAKESW